MDVVLVLVIQQLNQFSEDLIWLLERLQIMFADLLYLPLNHYKYTQLFYGHYIDPCVSWHCQLRTAGFCWSSFTACMPLLTAASALGFRRRCQSSPQWC